MSLHRTVHAFVALGVLTGLVEAPAFAQGPTDGRPSRPYRGLFGGGYGNTDQSLMLNASFGSGYDDNVLLGAVGPQGAVQGPKTASVVDDISGNLSYSLSRKRASLAISGGGSETAYQSLPNPWYPTIGVSATGSFLATSRTRISIAESIGYRPLSLLPVLPLLATTSFLADKTFISKADTALANLGDQPLDVQPRAVNSVSADSGAVSTNYTSWSTAASVSHSLTRRISLSLNAGDQQSTSPSHTFDLSIQSVGASMSVAIAKGLDLRAGYGEQRAVYQLGTGHEQTVPSHNIDVGLALNRALSISRRLTLSFSSGLSSFAGQGAFGRTGYFVSGGATLVREIGRTWSASVGYSRSVNYIEIFREPVFTDNAVASVGGFINHRVQLSSSVGTGRGTVGLADPNGGFKSSYVTTGATIGITRLLGTSISYSYYRYNFEAGVILPVGVARQTDRQDLRAALVFTAPLFTRTRKPDAAR